MKSMSLYCIGDLQGCNAPFQHLLTKLDFSPSRDTLYLLGDLVNRGPDSLATLRGLMALGDSAQCLLGNHDLHLLALWQGVRQPGRHDTVQDILAAPDRDALLDWLRHRPMAMHHHGWLMVHAGVLPPWSMAQTLALAAEVESALRGPDLKSFLSAMYGNTPCQWQDSLQGADRLRVIVNALTRLRFCTPQGAMEFGSTENASAAPTGYLPWFEAGHANCVRPLVNVDNRCASPPWPAAQHAGAGHRLRLGWLPDGGQAGRSAGRIRADSGGLRALTEAHQTHQKRGLSAAFGRSAVEETLLY